MTEDVAIAKTTLDRVAERIRSADRLLFVTHLSPDGDTIGSALALALALQPTGKRIEIVSHDPIPERYSHLPMVDRIVSGKSRPDAPPDSTVVFAFECPDAERTGWPELARRFDLVNIDHHKDNSRFGAINWIETEAPAVGEMVYRLLGRMDLRITKEVATCIYTSIMTDTGSFTYSNTTEASLRLGADMVAAGASPHEIAIALYDSNRHEKLELLACALNRLHVEDGGEIAWIRISLDDLISIGARKDEMEDLVNYPRSIKGVRVALIFKEVGALRYRVSLRAKQGVDVFSVAKSFGGGGHMSASGCAVSGSFEEVKTAVLKEAKRAIEAAR